jgi:methionyl-tRNA formyltransferase
MWTYVPEAARKACEEFAKAASGRSFVVDNPWPRRRTACYRQGTDASPDGKITMRITLVGSRHFGVTTFNMLRQHDVEIAQVVVADPDDRLAAAARAAGVAVKVQESPKLVAASEIADATDLIVTAHSHARISQEALAAAKLGGIGYHPSLLPRHRGIAAVEWTIKEGDPIAGGTIYHLADRMDAGAIAAQEWCFVKRGETARELWERALAPLGQKLLGEVIDYAKAHRSLPAKPQDEQFATLAPSLPKH